MKGTKVLLIILGILLIIGGIYCILSPGATFLSLAPICGIVMIVDAIGNIFTWNSRRKAGQADGWSLAAAIISLVFGLALLCNIAFGLFAQAFMTYMFIIWLIIVGIMRIAMAIKLKGLKNDIQAVKVQRGMPNQTLVGRSWGFILTMGIIMVIVGICGLFNPIVIAIGIGWLVGLCIVCAGVSLVSLAGAVD